MNLSHVNDINRLLKISGQLQYWWQAMSKSPLIPAMSVVILTLLSSSANAAGPRPKDLYLNLGGGIFTPTFTLNPDAIVERVDGELGIGIVSIPLIGDIPLQAGLSGATDNNVSRPENRTTLSLGGALGYKFNRYIGSELNIDLGFPIIQIRDIGLGDVLTSDSNSTGRIHIRPPELLPIGLTAYYTPIPDAFISPYFGAGAMVVFLNNRRAESEATEILIIEGDVEYGAMLQLGAHIDISQDWFGYFDLKYGYVDSPEFQTEQGVSAEVESLEFRHIRVGAGLRF